VSRRAIEFLKRRSFVLGMALGVFAASTAMLWFGSELFEKVEYTQDLDSQLGLSPEEVPVVALAPLPISKISKSLNISNPQEAMVLAKVMSGRVSSGFLPNNWEETCRTKYHPALCKELDAYFLWTEERSRSSRRRSSGQVINFHSSTIKPLQKADLGRLLSRTKKVSTKQLGAWSKAALQVSTCPRNASIALARKWEYHLGSSGAHEWMSKLDDHGTECLDPQDENAEYIFMRAGLWAVAKKDWARAQLYLEKAALNSEPREAYRVQYWLSRVYESLGNNLAAQEARVLVRKNYPLSWYAIEASLEEGLDPLQMAAGTEAFPDEYYGVDRDFNRSLSWFYLISRLDEDGSLDKFAAYIYSKMDSQTPPGVFQHVARVLEGNRRHRLQIMVLRKMFLLSSSNVTVESLRLYFPRPYFEVLDQSTPTMDSAVLLGLMRQESGFDPLARSGANAYGLLQILPTTARDIRKRTPAKQLYDSETNIEIGSEYFGRLVKYFDGSWERSLAAYNAGMGRVRGWSKLYDVEDEQLFMDLIPYRETREYVPSILRNAYWYHRLFPKMGNDLGNGVVTASLLKKNLEQSESFIRIQPMVELQTELEGERLDPLETLPPLEESSSENEN